MKFFLISISILFLFLNFFLLKECFLKNDSKNKFERPIPKQNIEPYSFEYQNYDEIIKTIKEWEEKAPELVQVKTYGKSTSGKDLFYIKISNEYEPSNKKVLITSCIHGNEPLSTSTIMAFVWKILSQYGIDQKITNIINNRTIYIVLVVSPDSYPNKRNIDGVDPNRNFPTKNNPEKQSVLPIKELQKLFLEIKPNSVLSGHTFGRVFLIPWGDSIKENPNFEDYKNIASRMTDLSNYKYKKASELYNKPIYGTEIDWYHRNGAFAMVVEFGTHQRKPTIQDTINELERTFDSILCFVEKSVDVQIKNSN